MSSDLLPEKLCMPEPLGTREVIRREVQHWQKLGRASGHLEVGYDADDQPVRIEYHWIRYFSRTNPKVSDIYTAELWARHRDGHWMYLLRPSQNSFVPVAHDRLRPLIRTHLNIDIGEL
ncbi:MAG: hypothetical protein U1E45_22790 [Geminicoccaceae bacterium]